MRSLYRSRGVWSRPLDRERAFRLLNQLPVWAPDPAVRKRILVDNRARLYAF